MLEIFIKLSLWLLITQLVIQGVSLKKSCSDDVRYYCACSLADIAEAKLIKMCLYEDLETVGCHPCPERLQENVNCNSCSNDTCPICSLRKFGAENSYKSHIKQQVFIKFAPHQGIFYIQPMQDYPGFGAEQNNEVYDISANVNRRKNQTNNLFPNLQETLEGYSLDNIQRNVNLSENTDENASNLRRSLQRNRIKWNTFPKQENFQTNLRSYQSQDLMNDKNFIERSLNTLETAKNNKSLEQPIAKFFIPEFTMPENRKDLTTLKDSNFYDVIKDSNSLESWKKEIDDILKHSENDMKTDNLFNGWINDINNALNFFENDIDWFKSSTHEIANNSELKFSDDGIKSDNFAEKWLEKSEFFNNKFKNSDLIKKWTEVFHVKQSFSESEARNNDWSDNLAKLMLSNSKKKISDYEIENNDKFKYETDQEYTKSSFSDKRTKINKWVESWTHKESEPGVFDDLTENPNWLENSRKVVYSKKRDMEDETESENSFKNSVDEFVQFVTRPKGKLVPPSDSLLNVANLTELPNTKSQNTTNFRLERVYRDIPSFSVWPKDSKKPDNIAMNHRSILKLYTLDPGRVQENFSDVLWFRYREYIVTPLMNKTLKSQKLKNSEIFKILNVSISSLKKSEMYISNCETCSIIYKLMLDSGYKNDRKLRESNNSSVIVFMDKPQFALHHRKPKLPANNQRKSKKLTNNNDSFIIQMNVDLLFVTSDDYKKLSQRNVSETNFLSNTPWRDLRKKSSFDIPESFFLQSKIRNLSRSLAHKDLKTLFKELMNMGQLTEELRKIVFVILSKMHKRKPITSMEKINHSSGASMILPTLNSEMINIKAETGHSDGHRRNKGIKKIKTSLRFEEFGEKTELKSGTVDYKENGSSSNLKKVMEEPYAFEGKRTFKSGGYNFKKIFQNENPLNLIVTEHSENTSYSDKETYSNESESENIRKKTIEHIFQQVNEEPKIHKSVKKFSPSEYALNKSNQTENKINRLKVNANKTEKINDLKQISSTNYKQIFHQNKKETINGSVVKIFSPQHSPNDTMHASDKNLKSTGLEKEFSSENASIENWGRSETHVNYSFETLKSENVKLVAKSNPKQSLGEMYEAVAKTNDAVGLKDDLNAAASQVENGNDFKYSPSEISRVERSLRNLDPVIHFRLTDKGILDRKKRAAAAIPQNHWCTIMSMRRNGNLDCTIWTFKKKCKLECHPGYSYSGSQTVEMQCVRRVNSWGVDINKACLGSGPRPERPRPDRPGPKKPKGFEAMHGPVIYDDDYDIKGGEEPNYEPDGNKEQENFTS